MPRTWRDAIFSFFCIFGEHVLIGLKKELEGFFFLQDRDVKRVKVESHEIKSEFMTTLSLSMWGHVVLLKNKFVVKKVKALDCGN